jgi:hypothetical protein
VAKPKGIQAIGVTKAVRQVDIENLTAAEQDKLITQVYDACAQDLADFVGKPTPRGPLRFSQSGPLDDPLLGKHWVQRVQADFALDDLPTGSAAWRVWVSGTDSMPDYRGPTARPTIETPQDRYREVYRERFGRYPD